MTSFWRRHSDQEPFDTRLVVEGSWRGERRHHASWLHRSEWGDRSGDMTSALRRPFSRPSWLAGSAADSHLNDYTRDYMPPGVICLKRRQPDDQSITFCRQTAIGKNDLGQAGLGGPARRRENPPSGRTGNCGSREHTKYNDARVNVLALATLNVWGVRCRMSA